MATNRICPARFEIALRHSACAPILGAIGAAAFGFASPANAQESPAAVQAELRSLLEVVKVPLWTKSGDRAQGRTAYHQVTGNGCSTTILTTADGYRVGDRTIPAQSHREVIDWSDVTGLFAGTWAVILKTKKEPKGRHIAAGDNEAQTERVRDVMVRLIAACDRSRSPGALSPETIAKRIDVTYSAGNQCVFPNAWGLRIEYVNDPFEPGLSIIYRVRSKEDDNVFLEITPTSKPYSTDAYIPWRSIYASDFVISSYKPTSKWTHADIIVDGKRLDTRTRIDTYTESVSVKPATLTDMKAWLYGIDKGRQMTVQWRDSSGKTSKRYSFDISGARNVPLAFSGSKLSCR